MNPLQPLWDRDFDYIEWIDNNRGEALLLGIVLIGIATFLFNIIFLPETSFQDSVFYLNFTRNIMEGGALPYPFPLKFYLTAGFFFITHIPIEPFSKLVPLLISAAYFALLYKIGRKLFRQNYLFPLAFALGNYWILNFMSINYNGGLVALLVIAFAYLYLKEVRKDG